MSIAHVQCRIAHPGIEEGGGRAGDGRSYLVPIWLGARLMCFLGVEPGSDSSLFMTAGADLLHDKVRVYFYSYRPIAKASFICNCMPFVGVARSVYVYKLGITVLCNYILNNAHSRRAEASPT